ncbi:unnamed protein product [Prorocentrum cordatum]|uniref:VOC domain-containing protein n=1 Tax=Prorocentrum cordatum TaxID=2364126 RepID=A0ABN9YD15_9DINO|nr:unnamed protein product [Polarella glacialis]
MSGPRQRFDAVTAHVLRSGLSVDARAAPAPCLEEIVLGDSAQAWSAAGFHTQTSHAGVNQVRLGGLIVTLTGVGNGLSGLLFSLAQGSSSASSKETSVGGVTVRSVGSRRRDTVATVEHPNGVQFLGELVIYAQDLDGIVEAFANAGVATHGGAAPKAMKGGTHACATYYLRGLRMLVVGPLDPTHPASENPPLWMFGRGVHGAVELTGWLPVCRDMGLLEASLDGRLGPQRKAAQRGRTVATLRSGAIQGLTGTFAFLSDGDGPLF